MMDNDYIQHVLLPYQPPWYKEMREWEEQQREVREGGGERQEERKGGDKRGGEEKKEEIQEIGEGRAESSK